VKPKIKVVGAEFERVLHAAPRSAHAPGLFLKPAHRSAPAPAIFDPLRSVFRSAHAPLTCSVLWMISCYHLLVVSVYIFYDRVENVNSESSFVLSIYHILFVEDNRILQCALDALQNWSEKWLLNVNVENV